MDGWMHVKTCEKAKEQCEVLWRMMSVQGHGYLHENVTIGYENDLEGASVKGFIKSFD